ncbi:hypothetical protein MNB_SV-10-238 [hydrothermal vent metagenome]|uniref:Uncharacterized protein n=1 Tax=hydrothermal vent metagenome TaxID=652676 RepID=A0A1W1CJ25_9ZZZZ
MCFLRDRPHRHSRSRETFEYFGNRFYLIDTNRCSVRIELKEITNKFLVSAVHHFCDFFKVFFFTRSRGSLHSGNVRPGKVVILFAFFVFVVPAFVKRLGLAVKRTGIGTLMITVESCIDIFVSESLEQPLCTVKALRNDLVAQTDNIEKFRITVGGDR